MKIFVPPDKNLLCSESVSGVGQGCVSRVRRISKMTSRYAEAPEGTLSGNIIAATFTKKLNFMVREGTQGYL